MNTKDVMLEEMARAGIKKYSLTEVMTQKVARLPGYLGSFAATSQSRPPQN